MINRRIVSTLLAGIASVFAASGQVKPDYFPEDVDSQLGNTEIRCFCKPGVRDKSRSRGLELAYGLAGKGSYEPEGDTYNPPFSSYRQWHYFEFDLKVPVINKPGLKVLAGYRYIGESINFKAIGQDFREAFETLDKKLLNSNSISAMLTKVFNEKHYFIMRLRNSSNGNYSGIRLYDKRYNIIKALAMYGIKPSEDFEWGFGLNYSSGFRNRTNLLPFVLYNRNFNRKWAIESALPAYVFIRRNISAETIVLGGVEYSSQSYRLSVDKTHNEMLDYAYNHSEILGSVRLEQQLAPWVWAQLKVGYRYNLSSDFESKADNSPAFQVEPTNAPFLNLSVFLSPPAKYVK
ncbi:MAG: hypothetical protein KDC65_08990 [Saprospiraceae bacterium]|nr:hypothetical protein [Saprospiraceae bacterium]